MFNEKVTVRQCLCKNTDTGLLRFTVLVFISLQNLNPHVSSKLQFTKAMLYISLAISYHFETVAELISWFGLCVCVWGLVRVCMCVCMRVCACVCACVRER